MIKPLSRRELIAGAAAAGALAAVGCGSGNAPVVESEVALRPVGGGGGPDLAVAKGPDIVRCTRASVEALGGMGAFVKSGQTVGLLINVLGAIPPAHTKPEVIRTVAAMCREAGAGEVSLIDWRNISQWEQNKLIEVAREPGITFRHIDLDNAALWREVSVPRGKVLKKVRMFNALWEPDVFIALPIFKNHSGPRFTGALKLVMGTTHPGDNRSYFHGSGRLEQCIADANTVVRPPDLIITDCHEVLTSNGPVGPGASIKPEKMVAGTDRVAIDTYCAPILGIDPAGSAVIRGAVEHGIGEGDLAKLNISEFDAA
jgi:uncharacterized protein (DUF362 family)